MFLNVKTGSIKVGDSHMDYVSFGKGDRLLVLIPGLGMRDVRSAALPLVWMYRIFAARYRVYIFDRKNELPEDYTVRDMADDMAFAITFALAASMKQAGRKKADIVGISQGGMIAQLLAIYYPQLVNRMVLGVTLSRPNETADRVVRQWIDWAGLGDYQAINRETFQLLYSDRYLKKYRLLLPVAVKAAKPGNLSRFTVQARACLTFDAYDELERIKCPVLVLGGRKDKVVTGEASEEIAEKLGCPIYMYEDLGHAAYEEAAEDFNRRMLEFLAEAASGM